MKKLQLSFILLFSCATMFAQTLSVETKSVSISAGTVSIDVSVAGLTAVKHFNFILDFDHTILSNPTFTNRLAIPNTGSEFLFGRPDHVYFYWDRNPYSGLEAIPDGVLFTVTFDIIGSVGDIAALTFRSDAKWTGSSYLQNSFASTTAGSVTITAALPVELTAFNAQPHQENVLLNWSTATEENNAGFDVERSIDGENWETLDFVLGHGTTLEAQDYTYEDTDPIAGMSYYRLRQVDYDGQFEYSDVISVESEIQHPKSKITLFPNPVTNQLTIQNATGQLTIYNNLGQPVYTEVMNRDNAQISMEQLPAGQYMLEIVRENGQRVVERIVKQ